MKSRRIIGSLLSITLLVTLMAGCGGAKKQETNGTVSSNKAESTVQKFDKTLKISWMGGNGAEIQQDNFVQKRLEEKFNVKFTNKKIDVNNKEMMNLMINSGEMPDAGFGYPASMEPNKMYTNGVTRTIPKALITKYAPNFTKMLNDNPLGWKMYLKKGSTDEYTCLTGLSVSSEGLTVLSHYRLDWLEKLNMVPNVKKEQIDSEGRVVFSPESITLDQMEAILKAFTFNDPDGNGKNDTYGISAGGDIVNWRTIQGAFGFQDEYNMEVNGEVLEWNILPQYKEFLKLMAKWYKMGIVDPEFATLNQARLWEKLNAGLCGVWNNPFGYIDNTSASYATRPPMSVLNKNPKAKLLVMAPEQGANGTRGTRAWAPVSPLNYNFYIGNSVDDEKLIRILQIMDYINFDKEALVWSRFGDQGVHFNWSGEPYKSRPVIKDGIKLGADTGFTFYNHAIYDENYQVFNYGDWSNKIRTFTVGAGKALNIRPFRWDYFDETNLAAVKTQSAASLKTISDEFFFKAVVGAVNIDSEWDKYVKTWKDAGGSKILEELKKSPKVSDMRAGK